MGDVKLEHLYKRYDDVTAVEDVSLAIEDGEFVTLVGPSGCGKSTTLEMIAGLETPSEGRVSIAGEDVTDLPPKDRRLSMVFQNIALFPHMDVRDNVSFGLRLRDFDDEEIDRRVEQAAETVQMDGMLDRMPDELSGGQRQRIAIARAIVREPEVFLMDEPLANLDAKLRVHMRTELQRLHRELGTTIVYVTHDQEEAMTMSNRLAVMNEGEVQQFADPLTCYYEPTNEFVAGFIGSPSMNFIDAEVTESGVDTAHFTIDLDPDAFGLAPGQAVRLGIRPEDVVLSDSDERVDDPTESIVATIDVVEPVGDEVFVYLLLGGEYVGQVGEGRADEVDEADQLLMSTPPVPELSGGPEGDRTRVRLDRSAIHLFDADSGEALVHGVTTAVAPDTGTQEAASETQGSDEVREADDASR
ncbi:ABC transporter ATP-binding protein [Halorientalis brevis]|uniref:ABC-type D-xylose/L-arabinose transporter n=1 Tax=Halorientalis brevis TaxID=1126241 RepID=A0ABD6C8N4_9EURY|nr:ABC transporter ATP-binding protein [Halorientalis brevis]